MLDSPVLYQKALLAVIIIAIAAINKLHQQTAMLEVIPLCFDYLREVGVHVAAA